MKHGGRLAGWLCSVGVAAMLGLSLGSLPALAQSRRPESILPPGFGGPRDESQSPGPQQQPPQQPDQPQQGGQPVFVPGTGDTPAVELDVPVGRAEDEDDGEDEERSEEDPDADLLGVPELSFEASPAEARWLGTVGLIGPEQQGFAVGSLGDRSGAAVHALMQGIDAPLVSRWATIMGRRLLASRLRTPDGISAQQFVADRAWLLLKMGESNVARALIQQVDSGSATRPIYPVALQVYLAAVDPAGTCPLVPGGVAATDDADWKMMRVICASFASEDGRADALFASARRQGTATGIDLQLAEKLLGASSRRRAVEIDWSNVKAMNMWRHGLALATGLVPPERLYRSKGRQRFGWMALAPTLSAGKRAEYAIQAGALGTLSNAAMVSLFSEAASDEEAADSVLGLASALRVAYSANTRPARVEALRRLMPKKEGDIDSRAYGQLVLASRAAGAIAPTADLPEDIKGWLIAAMLTSGLDRQAATWAEKVQPGSLGWALIASGAPGNRPADTGALRDFVDAHDNGDAQKAKLLVAGLAGLGRIDVETLVDLGNDLDVNFLRKSPFTQGISGAVEAKQPAMVGLYAMAALQGRDWGSVSPAHFYYLVKGLRQAGHAAEARMLVAEAATRA